MPTFFFWRPHLHLSDILSILRGCIFISYIGVLVLRAPECVEEIECRWFRIPRLVDADAWRVSETVAYFWHSFSPSHCHLLDTGTVHPKRTRPYG